MLDTPTRAHVRKPGSNRAAPLFRTQRIRDPKIAKAWDEWQADRRGVYRVKREKDPIYRLHNDMRSALGAFLRKRHLTKEDKSTLKALGYTKSQLVRHIERQFLSEMGWHNRNLWHIDHITPLTAFKCQSIDDPEFKAAWALSNLRPVWAKENLQKGAKRVFLL